MNWEKTQSSLGSGENSRRIREALQVEKEKRFGEIGEIETDLGLSSGYLAKVCRGEASITLERLLRVLERMGVDAGRFFANAIGTRLPNDSLLEEVERCGEVSRRLARIEKVAHEVELLGLSDPAPRAIDAAAMVADFVVNNGREQRRRLGAGRKYRHPAFAAAYLEHLDTLRYNNAKEARQNAEMVVVKLIPQLSGPQTERIILLLKAIGIYASCLRQKGKWATAARALRLALAIARRNGLKRTTVELLQRAACVLSDNGRFGEAMKLLDEALVLCVDLNSQESLGMVMVERGTALLFLGKYQDAVTALNRSLTFLQGKSQRTNRNRLVAHQVLGLAHQELGDLEQAEVALSRAVEEAKEAGPLSRASLLWAHGVVALKRNFYSLAEQELRAAVELFDHLKDPTEALVTLDLTTALLAQGKNLDAGAVAVDMAQYLSVFRSNPVAAAAISELVQVAIQGNLTVNVVQKTQDRIKSAQDGPQPTPLR